MEKRLLVIQGAPGVGKTTLSRKLAHDLSIPLVAKDTLKEALHDSIGYPETVEETQFMGRAAIQAMYAVAREYVQAQQLVMIEAPLDKEFAVQDITSFVPPSDIVQVHVFCGAVELQRRLARRVTSGERHPGHLAHAVDAGAVDAALIRNEPLSGFDCLSYDTTSTTDSDYEKLLQSLGRYIQ